MLAALTIGMSLTTGAQEPVSTEDRVVVRVVLEEIFHKQQEYERMFGGDRKFSFIEIPRLPWDEEEAQLRRALCYFGEVRLRSDGADGTYLDLRGVVAQRPEFDGWTSSDGDTYISTNGFTHSDEKGNVNEAILACTEIFEKVLPTLVFHLTDSSGNPVYPGDFDPTFLLTVTELPDGQSEVLLSLPLFFDRPLEAMAGHIDLLLPEPKESVRTYVSSADTGAELRLGEVPFRLERMERNALTIGCSSADEKQFSRCAIICCCKDRLLLLDNSSWMTGVASPVNLTTCATGKTFDEWLAAVGVDPEHPERMLQQSKEDFPPKPVLLQWKLKGADNYDGFWICNSGDGICNQGDAAESGSAFSARVPVSGAPAQITVAPRFEAAWNGVRQALSER